MAIQFATAKTFNDMPKRRREEDAEPKRPKKKAPKDDAVPLKALVAKPVPHVPAADIDFPRGGGSSFTPLETKAIRAEALQELKDEQIFKVRCVAQYLTVELPEIRLYRMQASRS